MSNQSTNIDGQSKSMLPKVFSFHHYISLSMGYAIGLGWVIIPARMMVKGGPLGVLLAIILSSILLYFIAKCYAELVSANPKAGGEAAIAYRNFGKGTSFTLFWLLSLGFLAYCPFYTSFTGVIFESFMPELRSAPFFSLGDHELRLSYILPGLIIGIFIILINYSSTKAALMLQSVSLYLLLLCVAVVAIVAFMNADMTNMQPYFEGSGTALDAGIVTFIVMSMICWYLFGFSIISQTAEEASPTMGPQDIGKAIVLSLILATIFYVVVHLFIPLVLP
jgi:basic amino acid/polyamine antiporter, APA family